MSRPAVVQTARRIWQWPIVLAVVSTLGLVAGLLGDGAWDGLGSLAVGAPVAVAAWFAWATCGGPPRDRHP